MTNKSKLRCYLFGGDTLLTECIDILLAREFEVLGVVSRNERIRQAVTRKGLKYIDLDTDYEKELTRSPFEYLFSITHLEIIPPSILRLATEKCINFHDGPLPAYAGLNTPNWAIINGESEYGISWHLMTPEIDRGEIITSSHFEISREETALSLNTKCFASALETFPDVLTRITDPGANYLRQVAEDHVYY